MMKNKTNILIILITIALIFTHCSKSNFKTEEDIKLWCDSLYLAQQRFPTFHVDDSLPLCIFPSSFNHFSSEFNDYPQISLHLSLFTDRLEFDYSSEKIKGSHLTFNSFDSVFNEWYNDKIDQTKIISPNLINSNILIPHRIKLAIHQNANTKIIKNLIDILFQKKLNKVYFIAESSHPNVWPHIPDSSFADYVWEKRGDDSNMSAIDRGVMVTEIIQKEFGKCPSAASVFANMANYASQEKWKFLCENIPNALMVCEMRTPS